MKSKKASVCLTIKELCIRNRMKIKTIIKKEISVLEIILEIKITKSFVPPKCFFFVILHFNEKIAGYIITKYNPSFITIVFIQ